MINNVVVDLLPLSLLRFSSSSFFFLNIAPLLYCLPKSRTPSSFVEEIVSRLLWSSNNKSNVVNCCLSLLFPLDLEHTVCHRAYIYDVCLVWPTMLLSFKLCSFRLLFLVASAYRINKSCTFSVTLCTAVTGVTQIFEPLDSAAHQAGTFQYEKSKTGKTAVCTLLLTLYATLPQSWQLLCAFTHGDIYCMSVIKITNSTT